VILAVGFTHLLPEVSEQLEELEKEKLNGYPLGYLLILLGYSVLMGLEKVVFSSQTSHMHKHGLQTEEEIDLLKHKSSKPIAEDAIQISDVTYSPDGKCAQLVGPLLLLLFLSIHSFLEGLVLGVQVTYGEAVAITIAICVHKWVESLSLGIILLRSGVSSPVGYTLIGAFATVTPVGIALGIVISNTVSATVTGIFNSLACGTFFFM